MAMGVGCTGEEALSPQISASGVGDGQEKGNQEPWRKARSGEGQGMRSASVRRQRGWERKTGSCVREC